METVFSVTAVVLLSLLVPVFGAICILLRRRIEKLEEENRSLRNRIAETRPLEPQPEETPTVPRRERAREWEAVLGGSILNKIGALVLVIGIALFLTYSFTRLTPGGRASIAAVLSVAILCCGVAVEQRLLYRVFARGLIGTGWAGLYATAYAMYALPATRVVADPFVASLLLLIVAGGMIAHSLRYRAQAITAVAYFSAFAALAATPSTSFAVVSLLPLAVSVLYLAWRFEWHAMAIFGLVATYATCVSRGPSSAPLHVTESLFVVYWMVFECFDLLRIRRRSIATPLALMFPLNAIAFLGLSGNAWYGHASHDLWKMAAMTAALFLTSAVIRAYMRHSSYKAALALSSVLTGLAIVGRVHGVWSPMSLAAEAEILYLVGVRFRSQFLRVLGSIGLALSLGELLWKKNSESSTYWPQAALFDAFLFYLNRFLWRPNLGFSFAGSALVAVVLVAECRQPYDCFGILAFSFALLELWLRKRLFEFRIQAYLGTAAGILLANSEKLQGQTAWIGIVCCCLAIAGYGITGRIFRSQVWAAISLLMVFVESVTGHLIVAPIWSGLMIAVLLIGKLRRWPDFKWQSYIIAALVLVRCAMLNFQGSLAMSCTVACLYAAQFMVRDGERYRSYFSIIGTFLLTALLYHEVSARLLTVALGLEAVALLVAGFAAGERILRFQGLALLLACILKLFLYDLSNLETMARILSFIALGVLLLTVSWIYTQFREKIKQYL